MTCLDIKVSLEGMDGHFKETESGMIEVYQGKTFLDIFILLQRKLQLKHDLFQLEGSIHLWPNADIIVRQDM